MIIANRLLQEVEFLKQGYFTSEEMDTIVSTLNIVGGLDRGIEKCKGARLGGVILMVCQKDLDKIG